MSSNSGLQFIVLKMKVDELFYLARVGETIKLRKFKRSVIHIASDAVWSLYVIIR